MLVPCLLLATPSARAGGALDRFEDAHRPSGESRKSDRTPSSSSSSSDDDTDTSEDDDDYDSYEEESVTGTSGGDATIALFFVCVLPPFAFACFQPAHRPAREVYGSDRLYIEPMGDWRDDALIISERRYHPKDRERFRWVELSAVGFRAFNEPVVYSHDLDATAWLGPVLMHLSWEHFYEQIQETDEWDHLNLYGGHLGANVLGPWIDPVELYMLAGVSVVHGEAATPAFDVGLDLRVYPIEPLALNSSAMLSVFEIGPVLLDARLQMGVALGPMEIRLGPRWLYQGDAQGFWGPSAAVVGRI